jgi:hypothetical protein
MKQMYKYDPIRYRWFVGAIVVNCILCLGCTQRLDKIEIVSLNYLITTVVAYQPSTILNHQRANRITIVDTSKIRSLEQSIDDMILNTTVAPGIDARIVCLLYSQERVDTISFGWHNMQVNDKLYSVDTTLLRKVAQELPDDDKKEIEEFLSEYYSR